MLRKFQAPIYKKSGTSYFLPEDRSRVRVYLFVPFVVIFSQGSSYRPIGPRMSQESLF